MHSDRKGISVIVGFGFVRCLARGPAEGFRKVRQVRMVMNAGYYAAGAILVSLCMAAWGNASDVPIHYFLATAHQDQEVRQEQEIASMVRDDGPPSSFINDLEFRVDIDQFERDKQSYGLRVKPKGWNERKLELREYELSLENCGLRRSDRLHQALLARYQIVIDAVWFARELALRQEMLQVVQDRLRLFEQYSGTSDFDIKQFMEADQQKNSLVMEIDYLQGRLGRLDDGVAAITGHAWSIRPDASELIGIARIRDAVEAMDDDSVPETIDVRKARLDARLAETGYDKERSASWLSFIQVSWDMDEKDDVDQAFSVECGITLPFFGSGQGAVQQKKLNAMVEKSNYRTVIREQVQQKQEARSKLLELIRRYDLVSASASHLKNASWSHVTRQLEADNPEILLFFRKQELEAGIRSAELARNVYTAYITMMDAHGKMLTDVPEDLLSKSGGRLW